MKHNIRNNEKKNNYNYNKEININNGIGGKLISGIWRTIMDVKEIRNFFSNEFGEDFNW